MLTYLPRQLCNKAIIVYIITLFIVSMLFMEYALPWWLHLFGLVSVFIFFYCSTSFSISWHSYSPKYFVKKLFWIALIIRIIYVIFIYNLNYELYGTYYESNAGDIEWYVPTAEFLSKAFTNNNLTWELINFNIGSLSDSGYVIYLMILYIITGNISSVVIPLIIKSILGAYTCIFIYKLARNHFGESVARVAGIFCVLQFNLIWWCGSMMKETEMIFLFMLFAYKTDSLLTSNSTKISSWIVVVLIGLLLFTFRTALATIAFVSLFGALLFTSSKIISTSKKIIVGIFVATMLLFAAGDKITEEFNDLIETASDTEYQQRNMEWRTKRGGSGNEFAKYAGAAVFAPLIFTIPFPSMVYTFQSQEMQMMVNGGNYIKNVLSFFVIFAMFYLLFTGEWRKHVFPIVLLVGYLAALVLSVFAQSGRFHMPIVPLEMMFAAYGLSLMNKSRLKWFNYALVLEFIFCIAWAWFKLKGRNLV